MLDFKALLLKILSSSGPEGMHAYQAIDADNGDYFRPPYNLGKKDKQHYYSLYMSSKLLSYTSPS